MSKSPPSHYQFEDQNQSSDLATTVKESIDDYDEIANRKREIENESLEQENTLRLIFSKRIFLFVALWIAAVLILVVLAGLRVLSLSDAVLITLLTTTTATVFGVLYVVVTHIFPKGKAPSLPAAP